MEVFLALLSNHSGALKGALPWADMLAQLLVLGLHGNDVRILGSVQHRTDDELFGTTQQRILAEVSVPDCQDLLGTVYALLEARTGAYKYIVINQKSGRVEDTAIDVDEEA